ncbi:MAG: hypothetical protein ABFS35_09430 [Bacteroidota bacterium]
MLSNSAKAQLQMTSQGWVGIGAGTPTRLLDVNGKAYFSCMPSLSGFYF